MRPALGPSVSDIAGGFGSSRQIYSGKVRRPKCRRLLLEYWLLVKLVLSCPYLARE